MSETYQTCTYLIYCRASAVMPWVFIDQKSNYQDGLESALEFNQGLKSDQEYNHTTKLVSIYRDQDHTYEPPGVLPVGTDFLSIRMVTHATLHSEPDQTRYNG